MEYELHKALLDNRDSKIAELETALKAAEKQLADTNTTFTKLSEKYNTIIANANKKAGEQQWLIDTHYKGKKETDKHITALETKLKAAKQAARVAVAEIKHLLLQAISYKKQLRERVPFEVVQENCKHPYINWNHRPNSISEPYYCGKQEKGTYCTEQACTF
jgi:predicted  nucleic acid-binding Zn-ribbon protein